MAFDPQRFAAWATTDLPGGRSPETIKKTLERLELLREYGLSIDDFLLSPTAAEDQVHAALSRYAHGGKPHHHRSLVKSLNWLAKYAAKDDPRFRHSHWPLPSTTVSSPRVLSDDDIYRALNYMHPSELVQARRRALVWVCVGTGLRRGEIGAMRMSDLDEDSSSLFVGRPSKRGARRRVPLPVRAWDGPLQDWLRVRPAPALGEDWFWTSDYRGRVRRRTGKMLFEKDFKPMGQELGLKLNFTILRHWLGRLRKRAGLTDDAIGALYGHNSRDSPRIYSGKPSWMDLHTALSEAHLPGYRRYPKDLPPWLPEVYGVLSHDGQQPAMVGGRLEGTK